jgi:cytochrome c biogenesis protein ResB
MNRSRQGRWRRIGAWAQHHWLVLLLVGGVASIALLGLYIDLAPVLTHPAVWLIGAVW